MCVLSKWLSVVHVFEYDRRITTNKNLNHISITVMIAVCR